LVKVGYSLPSIHVDGVPLTAFKHTIDGSASNGVNKVTLVGKGVGVSALIQTGLLRANFVFGIVHVDRACDIGEARVKTTRDQDVSISQADSH